MTASPKGILRLIETTCTIGARTVPEPSGIPRASPLFSEIHSIAVTMTCSKSRAEVQVSHLGDDLMHDLHHENALNTFRKSFDRIDSRRYSEDAARYEYLVWERPRALSSSGQCSQKLSVKYSAAPSFWRSAKLRAPKLWETVHYLHQDTVPKGFQQTYLAAPNHSIILETGQVPSLLS